MRGPCGRCIPGAKMLQIPDNLTGQSEDLSVPDCDDDKSFTAGLMKIPFIGNKLYLCG